MVLTVRDPGAAQGLVIPWSEIDFPLYNTVKAIAAGAGLLLVADLGRRLRAGQTFRVEGYALALLTNGILLTTTGLHMSLTWPLAPGGFAYDNIIFGEPALVFGVVQLVGALGLWLSRDLIGKASPERDRAIAWLLGPSSVLGVGIGLGCFGIAAAGVRYQLWVAPPEEPISGSVFGQWPWFEITFIAGLYVLTGLGAVLLPLALRSIRGPWSIVVIICWALAGSAFLLFGAFNYFSHIGLIINTTPSG